MHSLAFDPVWEEKIYSQGKQLNQYPYDRVVSFVFRYSPKNHSRNEVRILEVGCGAGNNLRFAAREGFQCYGLDGSKSAIDEAIKRTKHDGLTIHYSISAFSELPYQDSFFDLVIDRGAITCVDCLAAQKTIAEIYRVMKPEGKFFFNPFSDLHTSFSKSKIGLNNIRVGIFGGSLLNVGQIYFYSELEIDGLFKHNWSILEKKHLIATDYSSEEKNVEAEWLVVAQKYENE